MSDAETSLDPEDEGGAEPEPGSSPRAGAQAIRSPEVFEAQVEPFEGTMDGESEREALAEGRKVEVSKYSPAKTRESMRVGLGVTIVVSALAAGTAGGVSAAASGPGTNTILTGVFSPLLGLAGAVVGFYFGGKDSST